MLYLLVVLSCCLAVLSAYKVELNDEITAKVAQALNAESNPGLDKEKEYEFMKQLLEEMTTDPEYQEVAGTDTLEVDPNGETDMTQEVGGEKPPPNCHAFHGCTECIEGGCGWCLAARSCKPDEAWQCQGQEDHVGYSGIGSHTKCPTDEELIEARRLRREKEGGQGGIGASSGEGEGGGEEVEEPIITEW